eukprot:3620190-Amphidinium_carterae.2
MLPQVALELILELVTYCAPHSASMRTWDVPKRQPLEGWLQHAVRAEAGMQRTRLKVCVVQPVLAGYSCDAARKGWSSTRAA